MARAAQARRIARGAAHLGGGLGLLGAAVAGVLLGQVTHARRTITPLMAADPPAADGRYGADRPGATLTLALLGDSSMVGHGVLTVEDTPGALLGTGLAALADRPVRVVSAARTGAVSADLRGQVRAVLPSRPDVAVVLIGGNDVTHRVRVSVAVAPLAAAVRELVRAGAQVVVGTCPDLGTIQPIQPPLKWVARRWSRDLAAAQTVSVVQAGGRTVSLGDLLGPEFAAHPAEMFAADRFHPSAAGYARAVAALLPSVGASLGLGEDPYAAPRPDRGEGVRSLAEAALEAVEEAGTEVTATSVAGREDGPWGRWAALRRRMRVLGEEAIGAGRGLLRVPPLVGAAAAAGTRHDSPERAVGGDNPVGAEGPPGGGAT